MSGIAGLISLRRDADGYKEIVEKMVGAIKHRGHEGVSFSSVAEGAFGAVNFYEIDGEVKAQPFKMSVNENTYVMCFDGELYNRVELRETLTNRGYKFITNSDAEIVLKSYVQWGAGFLNRLSGIYGFMIWDYDQKELLLARDRFGIKPLYYSVFDERIAFSSEIKGILAHPEIDAELDTEGISELIGLGPSHAGGSGIFKNIFEIKPAHFAVYNKDGFSEHKYWELENIPRGDDYDTAVEKIKELTMNAIGSQLKSSKKICFFLSGGIDSSSIVAMGARKFGKINTYSLEYKGHDQHFKANEYQPNSDSEFIKKVVEMFDTKHETIEVDAKDLIARLKEAAIIRDQPGMGDIDASLLCLCEKIGKKFEVSLSGECGDEAFGGYPWFHRRQEEDNKIFPWLRNLEFRENLLAKCLSNEIDIKNYIKKKYEETKEAVPLCPYENEENRKLREMTGVTYAWFMYTLGERSERIGMSQGLQIRMPYCDHKLMEYLWNTPWSIKNYQGREKGLMRKIFEGLLPDEVVWRKKSPYPKTHDPEFERLAKAEAKAILEDNTSDVTRLIDKQFVLEKMDGESDYGKPWFGQLMAEPQLYAYIIQLDAWLRHYDVKINI